MRSTCLIAAALLLGSVSSVQAATFRFDTDPFAGSTALITPGRQFVGNELFIPNFSVAQDVFSFDPVVFKVSEQVTFFNGLAANLPTGGLNVIVLQDSDNDNNPATPFNAGAAADLIAARIDESAPGFFIYFNSVLNVNRLAYSTDLSTSSADIKIVARLTSPTGQGAIDALPTFRSGNFELTSVPEPATLPALALGTVCFGIFATGRLRRPAA